MRIACLLYGQPRDYIEGHRKIYNLFNQNHVQVDYFFHCWLIQENETYKSRRILDSHIDYNNSKNAFNDLIKLYKPVEYEFENSKEFTHTIPNHFIHPNINVNNTLSQMYSRNKVRNLFKSYVDKESKMYDFCIMTRFDNIYELPNIDINSLKQRVYIDSEHRNKMYIFPDNFIIMPQDICIKWFNIYDELYNILNNQELKNKMNEYNEPFVINAEHIIFAKYLFEFNNLDNISFFN